MFAKKNMRLLPILAIVLCSCILAFPAYAKEGSLQSQLLDHAGKSYAGSQDPSYLNYDLALREYMVDRIKKRFGISLDPKIYSGFDLLEIEALLRFKKAEEPSEIFLKKFPKSP
jgi:ABC-type oligopeptide transport system substrate-binding subunit